MKTIQNNNMKNQSFRMRGEKGMIDVKCDEKGRCELPDDAADKLLKTPGWTSPTERKPRKPPQRPAETSKPSEPSGDDEGGDEGAGGDDEGSEDEVPPYEDWAYKDLVKEAQNRMEDANFQPPDSKSKEDIIKALKADDARGE